MIKEKLLNIILYSRKKSQESKKAQRFFKERNLKIQEFDLNERELGRRELDKFIQAVTSKNDLIDKNNKSYKKKLAYLDFDPIEEILNDQSLLKAPIIRVDQKIFIGFDPKVIKDYLSLH